MLSIAERFKFTGEFAAQVDSDRTVGITTAEGGKRLIWTITTGGRMQQLALLPDTYQKLFELMASDIFNNEITLIHLETKSESWSRCNYPCEPQGLPKRTGRVGRCRHS